MARKKILPEVTVRTIHTNTLSRRGDVLTLQHTDLVERFLATGVMEVIAQTEAPEEVETDEEGIGGISD